MKRPKLAKFEYLCLYDYYFLYDNSNKNKIPRKRRKKIILMFYPYIKHEQKNANNELYYK